MDTPAIKRFSFSENKVSREANLPRVYLTNYLLLKRNRIFCIPILLVGSAIFVAFGFLASTIALAQDRIDNTTLYSDENLTLRKELRQELIDNRFVRPGDQPDPIPPRECPPEGSSDVLSADVVAIDHPMVFNRLGAQNVNWMMYALRHDIVDTRSGEPLPLDYSSDGNHRFRQVVVRNRSRHIALRPDLRPRPLVLRVNAGGYLRVRFTNLLESKLVPPTENPGNPFNSQPDPLTGVDHPMEHAAKDQPGEDIFYIDDQVASRTVGFHPQGLELVSSIADDSSHVGANASSLVAPGNSRDYCFHAPEEGSFLVSNLGAVFGGEGSAGNSGVGLFGAVTVQPAGSRYFRSQVTEEELRLATRKNGGGLPVLTPEGQPVIDYEARYPNDCMLNGVWCQEGKADHPILSMVDSGRIWHGDVNAIIAGPGKDGHYPLDTYPLGKKKERNPTLPNRLEPFREFVTIFHDENAATQAFPYFFEHPELGFTLHGVRDAFMINYGSGGIGAELIANRLKAGPMQDCLDCAYEEFFLSAFVVGDPAMLVDKPTNLTLGHCQPEFIDPRFGDTYLEEREKFCVQTTEYKADTPFYPHDPANVHHSYIGDFVKFRNMHSGKEQHVFHLHNHQWLFNPNDDNSNYIDAQGVGPGSGYTYEIAFGGSGNRNKTVGDAIYHCHLYPHFAQGMWYLWRNHDVMETGTPLRVSGGPDGFHEKPYGLWDGTPQEKVRALPDGELNSGAPIPAVVPLPGKAMPVLPGDVIVNAKEVDKGSGSLAQVIDRDVNPGYPFFIAGIESSVGHRPTTPPLDMLPATQPEDGGWNGGLPRHALLGYKDGGHDLSVFHRLSAEKHIEEAKPVYYPENGTQIEQVAMRFHAQREHPSWRVDFGGNQSAASFIANGNEPVGGAPFSDPCIDDYGNPLKTGGDGKFFGGQFKGSDPSTGWPQFSDITVPEKALPNGIEFGGDKPRVYKGANIQLDVVFNKLGYHYPQQRILTLWEDVAPTLAKRRPPEPLVLRMNTFDCAQYLHTNLMPKDFYLDDYQITTPTDVVGQHIHLPKWDLPSADGSANGWNYEDGTFSPAAVRERIAAINAWNTAAPGIGETPVPAPAGFPTPLQPTAHPFFGALPDHQAGDCERKWQEVGGDTKVFEEKFGKPGDCDWLGARTTMQRWFSDPVVNAGGVHRGLGTTFTHDHLGPSTHQQVGLYATMLSEPPGSEWKHNETGTPMYTRADGGPTSWQAIITGKNNERLDADEDGLDDSHREFFLQFGDFQHAYQKDVYVGVNADGVPIAPKYDEDWNEVVAAAPTDSSGPLDPSDTFRFAINPSLRKPATPVFPDIVRFRKDCPGGPAAPGEMRLPHTVYSANQAPQRPCPEAISADDVGFMVTNYRNEPIAARVFDPGMTGPDGKQGNQSTGIEGDLAYAFRSIATRAIPSLNTKLGDTPYPALTQEPAIHEGDPFTPTMRTYSGDLVRVKIQAGSHEHEHNSTIHGMTWLQAGSGFGQAPHSGWRNAQNAGLSEQFTFTQRIIDMTAAHATDRLYAIDTSQDGLWTGVWGLLRSYSHLDAGGGKLQTLPSQPRPTVLRPNEGQVALNDCPKGAPVRQYFVSAVLANSALGAPSGITLASKNDSPLASNIDPEGGTLVYNPRDAALVLAVHDEETGSTTLQQFGAGPLHDPTAILFVRDVDLANGKLIPGRPVEPLVLRASAGDCIRVRLTNRLPRKPSSMPDLYGYTLLSAVVERDTGLPASDMTSFNNNLLRPSNRIGLHPQMVLYDMHDYDGGAIGLNNDSTVGPSQSVVYQWYAGLVDTIASAGVTCPAAQGALQQDYALLNVFSQNPRLRPLNQVIDGNRFGETIRELIDPDTHRRGLFDIQDPDGQAERPRPLSPEAEKSITTIIDRVVQFTQNFGDGICFDEPLEIDVPTEPPDTDELLPPQSMLDRAARLERRQQCQNLIQESRPFQDQLRGIWTDQSLLEPLPEEIRERLNREDGQGNNVFASALRDGLIAQPIVGPLDPTATDPAFPWRPQQYPLYSSDSTTLVVRARDRCRYVGVEFGGSNLTPPDRIKQGQKAAIGALIIEPENSVWREWGDDFMINRQNPGINQANRTRMRATADVGYPWRDEQGEKHRSVFRDLAVLHQKGINMRFGDGKAVPSIAAEKETADQTATQLLDAMTPDMQKHNETAPEDAHDSGQMAINYGTEPAWFRFGLPPDSPFGNEGFANVPNAHQVLSNQCCGNGGTVTAANSPTNEPYIPILPTHAGQETRLRVMMPTGVGRGTVFQLHGHSWPRDPHLAERVGPPHYPLGSRPLEWGTASRCIGDNALAMAMGGQESVTPMSHFEVVVAQAGGKRRIPGDFLMRDHGGFGQTQGLWSLMRVSPSDRFNNSLGLRADCE